MYLDLDQFKVVNDTCGHQAGDRLLKQVTGLLQTRIRDDGHARAPRRRRVRRAAAGLHARDRPRASPRTLRQAIRDFRFVWQRPCSERRCRASASWRSRRDGDVATHHERRGRRLLLRQGRGPQPRARRIDAGGAPERHREMQWVSRITAPARRTGSSCMCQPIVPIGGSRDRAAFRADCCACATRAASWCYPRSSFPRPSATT